MTPRPLLPAIAAARRPIAQRFWAKVAVRTPGRCWDWHGSRSGWRGDGQFAVGGRVVKAHRLAWVLHYGTDPGDLLVRQRCGNRRCVNPRHLYLADEGSIIREVIAKRRPTRGERSASCRLTQRQARRVKFGRERTCQLVRDMGVHRNTINAIRFGQKWAWLREDMLSMTAPQMERGDFRVNDAAAHVQPRCAQLFAAMLAADPRFFLSRDDLIRALWNDPDQEPDYPDQVVAIYLTYLRRAGVPIENNRGVGWRVPEWARGTDPQRRAA